MASYRGASAGSYTRILAFAVMPILACGTLANGSHQSISISSSPPAACVLVRPGSRELVAPATIELDRKRAHTLIFDLPGYHRASRRIERRLSGWIYPSALLGGLVLGILIDVSSGGAYALEPASVAVELEPLTAPNEHPSSCAAERRDAEVQPRANRGNPR